MTGHGAQDAGHLRRLVELSLELGRNHEVGRVLQSVADATLELLDADRAFVILRGTNVVARAYAPGQSGEPSLSVANFALREGKEVVTADISDTELSAARSVMNLQLRAVLCVPLSNGRQVSGALYADSARRGHDEMQELVWLARAYANHASVALKNTRRLAEVRRRSRAAREAVHDIRNLAGGIDMGLDELQDLDLPDWARETLRDVRQMNRLSLQTATGALTDERRRLVPIDLAPLIRVGLGMQRFEARRQGVSLAEELQDLRVDGDAHDLARLFANLLGNAVKYTPEGGTVHVHLAADDRDAVLTVRDEGPGIPPDELEAIFRHGYQATGAAEGFGLGLGICLQIVRRHGGRIRASNEEGGGAAFRVVLPLTVGEQAS